MPTKLHKNSYLPTFKYPKILGCYTPPLLTIVSRPCLRSCKARESALVHTLLHITNGLYYDINDLHYAKYIVRHGGPHQYVIYLCLYVLCYALRFVNGLSNGLYSTKLLWYAPAI
jgi:hypothetical protein